MRADRKDAEGTLTQEDKPPKGGSGVDGVSKRHLAGGLLGNSRKDGAIRLMMKKLISVTWAKVRS